MTKATRTDIQQAVTDSIIARIEEGGLLPWQCPWTKTGEQPIPYNWLTKQSYNGINILILWMRAMMCGYSTNAWLTFKQARQLKGHVRKGEKAVQCIFVKRIEVDDESTDGEVDENGKRTLLCRNAFSLFNVEQVEGLDDLPAMPEQPHYNETEAVDAVDRVAEVYCANTGVEIRHGGEQAYYSPALDIIKLPTTFHEGSGYAATLAHELIHSTGHKTRFDRFDQQTEAFKVFKASYAFEELIAEIGAAFTCAELGIQGQHEQHASYLDHWLTHLKSNKTFIFKAAASASKAHSYLMRGGVELDKTVTTVA
jgi:antirestriction protein ArdC